MKTVILLGGPDAGQRVEVHGSMTSWSADFEEKAVYKVVPMCSHGEVHWFGVLDGADPLALLIAGYAAPKAERLTGMAERLAVMLPAFEATDDTRRMDFLEDIVMRNGQTLSADRERDSTTSSPTYGDLPTVCLFTIPSQHVRGIGFRGAVDEAMAGAQS